MKPKFTVLAIFMITLCVLAVFYFLLLGTFSEGKEGGIPIFRSLYRPSLPSADPFAVPVGMVNASASRHTVRDRRHLFVSCLLSPEVQGNGSSVSCEGLCRAHSFTELRVDASECAAFIRDGSDIEGRQALLQPYTVQLRPKSTDGLVFSQVYCADHFTFLYDLLRVLPADRYMTVLDAGANVGAVTLLLASLLQFRGHVVAVEANPGTVKVLERNVAFAGSKVTVVPAALTAAPAAERGETLDFAGQVGQYWGFRVTRDARPAPGWEIHKVPSQSLGQLEAHIGGAHFDFIKLDVEGEEAWILKDPKSQASLCQARCIFMELHEWFQPGCVQAYHHFMQSGCPVGRRFRQVAQTGEYLLICREDLLTAACGS